jgi:ferric-dicitrate binding protein FerR (iron transport regulator)
MRRGGESKRHAEAEASLRRLEDQAERTMAPAKAAPPEQDWTERWGRRIGLALGYGLALYLVWHLLTTYVIGP